MRHQPPPRGGIKNNGENKFRIISEHYAETEITSIIHFNTVPDYKKLSISSTPILGAANGRYHCVDGWQHIEKAQSEGKTSISCKILTIPDDSEAVLAWLKSYVRTGSIDCNTSYAERGRNVLITKDNLLAEGYIKLQQGGARKGESFADAANRSVVKMLAKIFKRSERTIQNYLDHFNNLNTACINDLVNADVGKSFFAAIESAKAAFIKKNSDLHDETLPEVVSAQVSEWFASFDKKTGKVALLAKPNGKKNTNKTGAKLAAASGVDTAENKNGAIPEVMESEKKNNSAPTPNAGEGVKELFNTSSANGVNEDKKETEHRFEVFQGGGKQPEADLGNSSNKSEGDEVYNSLDKIADEIKLIAKRRPSLDDVLVGIQDAVDALLDLKEAVAKKIQDASYEIIFDEDVA